MCKSPFMAVNFIKHCVTSDHLQTVFMSLSPLPLHRDLTAHAEIRNVVLEWPVSHHKTEVRSPPGHSDHSCVWITVMLREATVR